MTMADLQDQAAIDEAMSWLTEHVWGDDVKVILSHKKQDDTILKARSLDYREKIILY